MGAFFVEEPPCAEVIYPGAYRSICVELKVHHLVVCAVDKSAQLGDLEGTAIDASEPTGPAFRILKNLVSNWLADASANHNPIADHLLQNLYRWISNPASKLHDHELHRCMGRLMQKLFLQLVSEMRKLGAQVIL